MPELLTARCGCRVGAGENLCSTCESCLDCSEGTCTECGVCSVYCCECTRCRTCREVVESTCPECDRCSDCCSCRHCEECEEAIGSGSFQCEHCYCCSDCCSCHYCPDCGNYVSDDNWVTDCDHCIDCCNDGVGSGANGCVEMPHCKNRLRFREANKKQFKVNKLKRYISVEIEVCGFKGTQAQCDDAYHVLNDELKVSIVSDGSLPDTGFEINTQPANGDVFISDINKICSVLNPYSYVDEDAGLHVHVNAKDMHHTELRNLVLLYSKVEKALFNLCEEYRVNGQYSKTCADEFLAYINPKKFRKELVDKLYGCDGLQGEKLGYALREAKQSKYQSCRYSALNLHSYFLRGTVEFRHHEGTLDPLEIANWSLVCAHVVEAAAKLPYRVIENLPEGDEGLYQVLPPELVKWAREETRRKS